MAGLFSSLFKKYPSTEEIEGYWKDLREAYERFKAFEDSDELKAFMGLSDYVHSEEFLSKKKEIEALSYKGSEEENKENELKAIEANPAFKSFQKTIKGSELSRFLELKDSALMKQFFELKSFVESDEFQELKRSIKFENTTEYQQEQEYLSLKKNRVYQNYVKLKKSSFFTAYQNLIQNGLLERYNELERIVNSEAFKEEVKGMDKESFAGSGQEASLAEYKELKANRDLKLVLKIMNKPAFADFKSLYASEEIEKYEILESFVTSDEFKERKNNASFIKSEAYQQFVHYKSLLKNRDVKFYLSFVKSKAYLNYLELNGSELIEKHKQLTEEINSPEFQQRKSFLLDKNRFKTTEEYKQLLHFEELKKSDGMQWFLNLKEKNDFDKLLRWRLTFEDHFSGDELDESKWLTKFYWGETVLNESYSLASDLHAYKMENVKLKNDSLCILTQAEQHEAKAWGTAKGFHVKPYRFTSGIANSGLSFRQQYGKFVAKIRCDRAKGLYHAFWLVGESITPHIDIAKFDDQKVGKMELNYYVGNGEQMKSYTKKASIPDTRAGFLIYSLEWTPDALRWYVNDVLIHELRENVPDSPMYVAFSSGLRSEISEDHSYLFEIDWIKIYQLA